MSGFVVRDPNTDADPDAPGQQIPADVVACDAFWPSINLTELRDAVRLDTAIPANRLRDAVRNAMLEMGRALAGWRAAREAEGATKLSDVTPRRMVDGQSDYAVLWARGIYSIVAGDLSERLRGMTATKAGHDRADELETEGDVHARNVVYAVRDFLGRTRVRASSI